MFALLSPFVSKILLALYVSGFSQDILWGCLFSYIVRIVLIRESFTGPSILATLGFLSTLVVILGAILHWPPVAVSVTQVVVLVDVVAYALYLLVLLIKKIP